MLLSRFMLLVVCKDRITAKRKRSGSIEFLLDGSSTVMVGETG
jgi:hypothetical protein